MEELSISYFCDLLAKHNKELKDYCTLWNSVLSSEAAPDDVNDEIRTTIGLTNLLMKQKMKQFGELIDDSEHNRGEKEITCLDLQGFWDMVYNEVEKIQKSFKKLERCQNNKWVFVEEPIAKNEPKKKPGLALTTKVTVAAKERALAARQRLAEAKLKMKVQLAEKENPIEIHVASSIENSSPELTDQISIPKENVVSSIEDNMNSKKPKEQAQHKKSLKIKKIQQSKANTASENLKKSTKISNKKNKENLLDPEKNLHTFLLKRNFVNLAPDQKASQQEPPSSSKRKSPKEIIPLQCLTRSAKKALMERENALKNK